MVNLRRYARLRVNVDVDYRATCAGQAVKERTISRNISVTGICFEAPNACGAGTRVGLEIFLPPEGSVRVEGRIVWYKKFEDGASRAGASFVDLKEEDKEKLSNFIFRKMYEMTGVGDRQGLVKYAKEHGWEDAGE